VPSNPAPTVQPSKSEQQGQTNQPPGATGAPAPEKANRPKTSTLPQLRATEAKSRTAFGVASAMLEAIAVGGLLFAIVQICWTWCAAPPAGADPDPDRSRDRAFVFGFAVLATGAGVLMQCWDIASESYDNTLVNLVLTASVTSNALSAQSADVFHNLVRLNLLIAYVAAALLLVYLASLSIPSSVPGDRKARLAAFQFIILIGGAIFAFAAYANQTALAWVTLGVDEATGAPLIEALKAIPDLWSIASSAFLFTAIAIGYFAITAANPAVVNAPVQSTSTLDLRTPTGEDFKAFGWVVQFAIALAPIWLPAGLTKILEFSSKLPGQ
jgi:hypothetical protein